MIYTQNPGATTNLVKQLDPRYKGWAHGTVKEGLSKLALNHFWSLSLISRKGNRRLPREGRLA